MIQKWKMVESYLFDYLTNHCPGFASSWVRHRFGIKLAFALVISMMYFSCQIWIA